MALAPDWKRIDQLVARGPILVLGSSGQLGKALVRQLGERGRGVARSDADFTLPNSVIGTLNRIKPSAVINAAAYTQVDQAEKEEELALLINGETPGAIARWCATQSIPFIHVSTDYVFSGEGALPWKTGDIPSPLNIYGRSKLYGERAIAQAGGRYLIFRTSWIYDAEGKNFLLTMLRLGTEREKLRVIGDQHGAPTYAPQLATGLLAALGRTMRLAEFPSNTYHLCGGGSTTWHGFAVAIFEEAKRIKLLPHLKVQEVEKIATSEFPTPARRPANSRLDMESTREIFGVTLPDWKNGLLECLRELKRRPAI